MIKIKNVTTMNTQFEDILEDRRKGSDLRWAAQEWLPDVVYEHKKSGPVNLHEVILNSQRVQRQIQELSKSDRMKNFYENKVREILKEMCHTQDMGVIRKFALPLSKIMKRIYRRIFVNTDGINSIKSACKSTPVVFIPSHRSYADFLLISYVSFCYKLTFPVIAAGMDFMSMAFIGDMLRGAGAFYIKRSFVNDPLYWCVFQEYVDHLLTETGHPLEFFIEGTRSRTGKSLQPKLGLLSCVLECWLRARIPDIAFVPISITYGRTLEEFLYARENLGIPKPKESTSGLLKAMKILNESYGDIYFKIGTPIYASQFLAHKVDRHLTVTPYYMSSLTNQELSTCCAFSKHLSRILQKNSVISLWSLCSSIFLKNLWDRQTSVSQEHLKKEVVSLGYLVKKFGCEMELGFSENFEESLKLTLQDHREIIQLKQDNVFFSPRSVPNRPDFSTEKFDAMEVATHHLVFQYYANQIVHVFVRPAILILALRRCRRASLRNLFLNFEFLVQIFSFDFVFEKELIQLDFDSTIATLCELNCITLKGDEVTLRIDDAFQSISSLNDAISSIFRPFIFNYKTACEVATTRHSWENEQNFVNALQRCIQSKVASNQLFSALSLDTCRNAAKMLIKLRGMISIGREELKCDVGILEKILLALGEDDKGVNASTVMMCKL